MIRDLYGSVKWNISRPFQTAIMDVISVFIVAYLFSIKHY